MSAAVTTKRKKENICTPDDNTLRIIKLHTPTLKAHSLHISLHINHKTIEKRYNV